MRDAARFRWVALSLLVIPAGSERLFGQTTLPVPSVSALKQLSMDELMEIEVTSVSKRAEKLLEAAAAIQVVTGDDIRRSGATSIPEALRFAGNLDVAQENAHEWAVSARGFASDVGNKLLVLMDGRTVYTPLFSGVFWDRQDYLLEDVDRIEVISGPGGALWGANAVNGVINITTKSAKDTQGLYLEAGTGTNLRASTAARFGGELSPKVAYRIYAKRFEREGETTVAGRDASDSWGMRQGGFRLDAEPTAENKLTFQGDLYGGEQGIPSGGVAEVRGGNLLGRWTHVFAPDSDMSLQVYYDRTHLELPVPAFAFAPAGTLRDDLDTYDFNFQHRFSWAARSHLVWGVGYRLTRDRVQNAPALAFYPAALDQTLWSGFVHNEISLRPDKLKLIVGSKVEHNEYTGIEIEPNVRLQWSMTTRQMAWTAVSRAVRTPSRVDRDLSQPAVGNRIVILKGDPAFTSETVISYEAGYRVQMASRLFASISTFYNDYDDLRSTSLSPRDAVFNLPFPFYFQNNLEGETCGFEFSASYQVFESWRLHGSYSLLKEDIQVKPGRTDFNNALNETSDPEQQASLRSSLELSSEVELNSALRWVDRRPVNNSGVAESIPAYCELDVHVAWRPSANLEVALIGRNLLHQDHPEFGVPGPNQIEIAHSVFGKVSWRY